MAQTDPSSAPQPHQSSQPLQPQPAPIGAPAGTDVPPIFKGSVSYWMGINSFLAGFFVELLGLAALIYGSLNYAQSIGQISFLAGMAVLAAGGLITLYIILRVRSNRYTITYRLIERETGLLVKRIDALDIGRVKHVDLKQSVFERVIDVGTIEVFSGDQETPIMLIEDIPKPRQVYEKLRDAVIDLSRRRGVIIE